MICGAILFDFDGTLVDARESAWELFKQTNEQFGLGIDRRDDFFSAFEGNFFDSLEQAHNDPAKVAEAKAHFLDLMRTDYRPRLIPGMADVVRSLASHYTLAVLSSNTMEAIRRTLGDAGIATCFAHVFSGDVEPSKAASIRQFLADHGYASPRHCVANYEEVEPCALAAENVYLVTDTIGDVAEARRCGIHAIGVAWGMHGAGPLEAAGAERVALWPQEISAWFAATAIDEPTACAACRVGAPCTDGRIGERGDDLDAAVAAACSRRRARRLANRRDASHRRSRPRPPAAGGELRQALQRTVARQSR
jgi:phosphoglycolate phosphatase